MVDFCRRITKSEPKKNFSVRGRHMKSNFYSTHPQIYEELLVAKSYVKLRRGKFWSPSPWMKSEGITVCSEGFLCKVAPLELKISPIMYFVIHNSVVLSKILKIVVPFWLLFVYVDYYQNNQFYRVKISFSKFCSMAQWFSIFWITPLNCEWQNA